MSKTGSSIIFDSIILIMIINGIANKKVVPKAVNFLVFPMWLKVAAIIHKKTMEVYYLDINYMGILDYGLEAGNAEVAEIALKHGARFDDSHKYDHMAYEHNSMDYYLGEIKGRSITEDDVRIIELMFEKGASTEFDGKSHTIYSNLFGKAVWAVLYNDEMVTDTEIEFIQVMIDNGLTSDDNLLLYDETPGIGYIFPEHNINVIKDDNYNKLMEMIGKKDFL